MEKGVEKGKGGKGRIITTASLHVTECHRTYQSVRGQVLIVDLQNIPPKVIRYLRCWRVLSLHHQFSR